MKNITAYHGTNARFSKFEQTKARVPNDVFGGGVAYFTDTLSVAKSYAATMARRSGGDRIIYEVGLKFNKLFDVDEMYDGDMLQKMINGDYETFARGSKLLRLGDDRVKTISDLRAGKIKIRGEDVFRGMSNGMVQTKKARERLISLGFDGLRHNGGVVMGGTKHNVYLAYRANQIEIKKRYIVNPKPVYQSSSSDLYAFIN